MADLGPKKVRKGGNYFLNSQDKSIVLDWSLQLYNLDENLIQQNLKN